MGLNCCRKDGTASNVVAQADNVQVRWGIVYGNLSLSEITLPSMAEITSTDPEVAFIRAIRN